MTVEDARFSDADEAWYARLRVQARRSFILGIIGYVIVVGVIAVTLWFLWDSVDAARSELNKVRGELATARNDLATAQSRYESLQKEYDALMLRKNAADQAVSQSQAQIVELKKQLDQIYDFIPHIVPVDEMNEKLVYGVVGEQGGRILSQAIEDSHHKLPFSGVNTPMAGFTSPGYATYLLAKVGVHTPIDQMPQQRGPPQNGDIIIYGAGYTMFYFDIIGKRFVIGMTPQGVLALDPNFSRPIKVLAAYQPR